MFKYVLAFILLGTTAAAQNVCDTIDDLVDVTITARDSGIPQNSITDIAISGITNSALVETITVTIDYVYDMQGIISDSSIKAAVHDICANSFGN